MKHFRSVLFAILIILLGSTLARAEVFYTVKDGDTLPGVASKFHIELDHLLTANELKEDSRIITGLKLRIPYIIDSPAEEEITQPAEPVEYIVKSGDCLAKIARENDVELEELLDYNSIDKRKVLSIGKVILIPPKDPPPNVFKKPESKEPVLPDKPRFKRELEVDVKASSIEGKNLLDLSQLEDAKVKIRSFEKPVELPEKIEINNESLKKKPESIKKDPEPIIIVNKRTTVPEISKPAEQKTDPVSSGFIDYEVERGDCVNRIARDHDVDPQLIFDTNNISKHSVLRIGQKLKIPVTAESQKFVKKRKASDSLISRNLAKRDRLVRRALQYQGTKYRYGGTSLTKGVDCSGFTMKVYETFGVQLPHSSKAQARMGKKVEKKNLLPGDLVFFSEGKGVSHCGIYIGNGKIIHTSTMSKKIKIDSLSESYFRKNYHTARRYL